MDMSQEKPLKAELCTLEDYHRRLKHLLERMERLEESLNTLPLASRGCYMDTEEKNTLQNQQRNDFNTAVETEQKELKKKDSKESIDN